MALAFIRPLLTCGAVFTTLIAVSAPRDLLAQRPSPAEGPWSGQAQCVVVAKFADYQDEQTHTWRLTGEAPTPAPRGSAQVYYTWPATWSVQGSGRKTFPSREPVAAGPEQAERWTIASEMKMSLRVTDLGTGRLRIGAEGQRGAPLGSIRVTEVSGRTRDASVQPWPFPVIEDIVASSTISGTNTRTYPEGFGVGWGQPPKAITTATCTWNFTRGGVEQSSANTPSGGANTPTGGRGVRERTPIAGTVFATPSEQATPPAVHPITTTPGAGAAASAGRAAATPTPTANSTSTVPPGTQAANLPVSTLGTVPEITRSCTLPISIPPASVRMHPGGVAFQVAGVRAGCSANCMLSNFPPVPNPYATINEVRFVVYRTDRLTPVTDATGRQDSVDVRTSMEHGRTYSFSVRAEESQRIGASPPVIGACGQTTLSDVTPPLPATPVITSAGIYQGGIQLGWVCVNQFESGYLVLGPGVPASGLVAPCGAGGGGYLIIRPLPARGTHTWVITPFWDTADERVIDVNRGGRATVTVP